MNDAMRHAAQRNLDAGAHLRPASAPWPAAAPASPDGGRGSSPPRPARRPGGTVMRRPRPPESMRSVRRRARSFSTILSGSERPATTCSRSSTGAGLGFVRLRKRPKDMARTIRDSRETTRLKRIENGRRAQARRRLSQIRCSLSAAALKTSSRRTVPRPLRHLSGSSSACRCASGRASVVVGASTCCGWP